MRPHLGVDVHSWTLERRKYNNRGENFRQMQDRNCTRGNLPAWFRFLPLILSCRWTSEKLDHAQNANSGFCEHNEILHPAQSKPVSLTQITSVMQNSKDSKEQCGNRHLDAGISGSLRRLQARKSSSWAGLGKISKQRAQARNLRNAIIRNKFAY